MHYLAINVRTEAHRPAFKPVERLGHDWPEILVARTSQSLRIGVRFDDMDLYFRRSRKRVLDRQRRKVEVMNVEAGPVVETSHRHIGESTYATEQSRRPLR